MHDHIVLELPVIYVKLRKCTCLLTETVLVFVL